MAGRWFIVRWQVDILVSQVLSHKDRPVDLYYAFRSTALDIITSYCFAQSWSTLSHPSFHDPILYGMDESLPAMWSLYAFPFLNWLLSLLEPLVKRFSPNMKAFIELRRHMANQVDGLLKHPELLEMADHEVVYHHLMTPQPSKGQHEIPSRISLWHEVRNILLFALLKSLIGFGSPWFY